MFSDPWFWVLGIAAVILLGLAKGGFMGVGNLATPMLALIMPPVQAVAVLLPILIVQDAVGVWAFRNTWDRHILFVLLPGAVIGISLGYFFAATLPDKWVLFALGVISIVFSVHRLWLERGRRVMAPQPLPDWLGFFCGVGSGLTSQIANAGSPPFQIWVLPRRLSRDTLVGTNALYFAILNWLRVPAYAALGQFNTSNAKITAVLLPVAIVSTFAGVRLVRSVSAENLYGLIYGMSIFLGVVLIWRALH